MSMRSCGLGTPCELGRPCPYWPDNWPDQCTCYQRSVARLRVIGLTAAAAVALAFYAALFYLIRG